MSELLLNEETMDQIRRAGGDELLLELFGVFLSHVEVRRKAILDSVKSEDASVARKAFHSIRSSSVTIGLQALSERAAELEDLAERNCWDEVNQVLPRLEDDLIQSVRCLELEVVRIADSS
ncbi:MAG: Hpt domain-containing protein [Thermoanaerobaculia bacterium]